MEWIKCSDRLPPQDEEIIVFNEDGKVYATETYISTIYDGKPIAPTPLDWTTYRNREILCWMPLPEAPK